MRDIYRGHSMFALHLCVGCARDIPKVSLSLSINFPLMVPYAVLDVPGRGEGVGRGRRSGTGLAGI